MVEYKQERFTIDRLCEFRNREVESDFMAREKIVSLKFTRVLMLFLGFAFALFIFLDYYFYGIEGDLPAFLGLCGATLFVIIITFLLSGKIERYDHIFLMISLTQLIVFALYLIKLYSQESFESFLQFMIVLLFIMAVFIIPNKWKNSLIAGCIILAAYLFFAAFCLNIPEPPTIIERGICLAICLVSCAIILYERETSRRKHYAAEQLLEFLSMTDRLTGIYNRGRFEHILNLWIKNMRHDPFCLLFVDIDNFKRVNDCFGHCVGDQVLKETTEIITANIRDDDIFARWGGEEFVILFGSTTLERATELAERLRKAVEGHNCGDAGIVTISIGVVKYHREESVPDFLNRADEKMYEAKKAGKNMVVAESFSAL